MMANKKGDIPVTLLLIGVFAVCTLAILSFFYSSYILHKSFDGVNLMEKANSRIEKDKLDHLEMNIVVNKFSPNFKSGSLSLFKEKVTFSVIYNP